MGDCAPPAAQTSILRIGILRSSVPWRTVTLLLFVPSAGAYAVLAGAFTARFFCAQRNVIDPDHSQKNQRRYAPILIGITPER
jgi:hypothetical protein